MQDQIIRHRAIEDDIGIERLDGIEDLFRVFAAIPAGCGFARECGNANLLLIGLVYLHEIVRRPALHQF